MLDDEEFFVWLSNAVDFNSNCLKKALAKNNLNKQNSKLPQSTYQDIYGFWLKSCINSTDSPNNHKKIYQFKSITDPNVMGNEVLLENGSKIMHSTNKMVYVELI